MTWQSFALLFVTHLGDISSRNVRIVNRCPMTVYPQYYSGPDGIYGALSLGPNSYTNLTFSDSASGVIWAENARNTCSVIVQTTCEYDLNDVFKANHISGPSDGLPKVQFDFSDRSFSVSYVKDLLPGLDICPEANTIQGQCSCASSCPLVYAVRSFSRQISEALC